MISSRATCCIASLVIAVTAAITAPVAQADGLLGDSLVGDVVNDQLGQPEPVRLPADDASHGGQSIEWWQWWMHLEDDEGHRYGATVVFFHFPVDSVFARAGFGVRRTDFRITDVAGQTVHRGSVYSADPVAHIPNGFAIHVVPPTRRVRPAFCSVPVVGMRWRS